jgi:phage I-like protein
MNMKPLLNRDFSLPPDGFVQAVPRGHFPIWIPVARARHIKNMDKSIFKGLDDATQICLVQIVDEAACAAIQNRFEQEAQAPNFAGLLFDYDHFSCESDQSSEAAAWGEEMQNRADGIYIRPRWAGEGEAKVKSGAFRFLSPVWEPWDCEYIGNREIRPLHLDRIGVTNDPNMKSIKPLSNRAAEMPAQTAPEPGEKGTAAMDYKAMLVKLLGLKPEANDAEIGAACDAAPAEMENRKNESDALKNRAETAEQKLAAAEKLALEAQVEKDLDRFKDKIANRDAAKALLLANRDQVVKTFEALAPLALANVKVLNRADGQTPPPAAEAQATRLSNQATFIEEVKVKNRCSSQAEANELARRLKPELFV